MYGSMWTTYHQLTFILDFKRAKLSTISITTVRLLGSLKICLIITSLLFVTVLVDACQLVKANSINGNKMNNIDIVYTMWENLKKTASMDVGQVSFHIPKQVRKFKVERRINSIVNRLDKTKLECHPDFRAEREARDASERQDKKKVVRDQEVQKKEAEKKRHEESQLKSYASLHKSEKMSTNYDDGNDSDDFM